MRKAFAIAVVLGFAATVAQAADKRWCSGVSESSGDDTLRIARIASKAPRVHFVSNPGDTEKTRDCPSAAAPCRERAFLVPGDEVLVDEVEGDFACVSFVSNRVAETGGWIPRDAIETLPVQPVPRPQDWPGTWKRIEATIKLKLRDGKVEAEGEAVWGSRDPVRVRNGAVHSGGFDGTAAPEGNRLAFGEGYSVKDFPDRNKSDCQVLLRHFGRYLVVEDNQHCGGANVSFSGIYVRAGR